MATSTRTTAVTTPDRNPPGTGTLGMALFLAALAMLFAASLFGYAIIRFTSQNAPPVGAIEMPSGLIVSTGVILLSSLTMHRALSSVAHERQARFRQSLLMTLGLAALFVIVQAPSMYALLQKHGAVHEQDIHLYGLIFMLILLHALHVVGGLIPMGVVTYKALKGRYDHEQYAGVKYVTMYWHFLDLIWVIMFATLLVLA